MSRRRDSLRKKRRKISGLHSNPNRGDRRGGSPVRVLPRESPTWGRMFLCREGYGNCFITGAVRFFAENGWLFDVFEIRDFRNGIQTRFVSPRVRQRRGRWSPPFVAPAGSRPEATGAFTPPGIPPPPPGHYRGDFRLIFTPRTGLRTPPGYRRSRNCGSGPPTRKNRALLLRRFLLRIGEYRRVRDCLWSRDCLCEQGLPLKQGLPPERGLLLEQGLQRPSSWISLTSTFRPSRSSRRYWNTSL